MDIPPIPTKPSDYVSYLPPFHAEDEILRGDPTIAKVLSAEMADEFTLLVRLYHPESGEFSCKVPSSAKRLINDVETNQIYTLRAIATWLTEAKGPIYFKGEWKTIREFEQEIKVANFLEERFV